jgi:hypothetical protein
MRNVADRLIAHETKGNRSSETRAPAAFHACERLRPHLATLMGNAGAHALVSRALVLANTNLPWLRAAHVNADGSLDGLDELNGQVHPDEIAEGGAVVLSQLLGLLVAFIGDTLTLRIVHEVWPKLSLNDLSVGKRRSE